MCRAKPAPAWRVIAKKQVEQGCTNVLKAVNGTICIQSQGEDHVEMVDRRAIAKKNAPQVSKVSAGHESLMRSLNKYLTVQSKQSKRSSKHRFVQPQRGDCLFCSSVRKHVQGSLCACDVR